MSEHAFETPEKRAFRERALAALEHAGFVLSAEIVPIRLAQEFGRNASVIGDFRSQAGNVQHAFYLVVDAGKPVSPWLVNIVRGAQARGDIQIHLIAEHTSEAFVRSCARVGVGLFELTPTAELRLVLEPGSADPALRRRQLRRRLTDLRRRAKTKLELNEGTIRTDFAAVTDLTAEMEPAHQGEWRAALETAGERWAAWYEHVSALADEADEALRADDFVTCEQRLDAVEALLLMKPNHD